MKKNLVFVILILTVFTLFDRKATAQTKDKWANSAWQDIHLEEIRGVQKEVEEYVTGASENIAKRRNADYVLLAVSKKAREAWLKNADSLDIRQSQYNKLDPALDALASSVAKKIGDYKPQPKKFAFRNPAEEQLMTGQLKQSATRKILKIGLSQANWEIYKDSLGLPSYRFKRGYIWARDTADDYPYCKLYYISIVQDYAGGGRYGASHAKYEDTNLYGCP